MPSSQEKKPLLGCKRSERLIMLLKEFRRVLVMAASHSASSTHRGDEFRKSYPIFKQIEVMVEEWEPSFEQLQDLVGFRAFYTNLAARCRQESCHEHFEKMFEVINRFIFVFKYESINIRV